MDLVQIPPCIAVEGEINQNQNQILSGEAEQPFSPCQESGIRSCMGRQNIDLNFEHYYSAKTQHARYLTYQLNMGFKKPNILYPKLLLISNRKVTSLCFYLFNFCIFNVFMVSGRVGTSCHASQHLTRSLVILYLLVKDEPLQGCLGSSGIEKSLDFFYIYS